MSEAQATAVQAPGAAPRYKQLLAGDRLPSLTGACAPRERFRFDAMAGRYLLYGFYLAADRPEVVEALRAVTARRDLFDDAHAAFIGVGAMPGDQANPELRNATPGVRFAWDLDYEMSRACGALPLDAAAGQPTSAQRRWILVDPSLRVIRIFPMNTTPVEEVIAAVEALPPPDRFGGVSRPAPILMIPNVFEPDICTDLIARYQAAGGQESGVHRDGQGVLDWSFKRRRDHTLEDEHLIQQLNWRLARRVTPEIEKLFFMQARYIERHIVGCYDAADRAHFSPHTDNGPGLTAHRRFAVSINLSGDFDGGEVVFPEYGMQGYKAPPGWAVVFPCAILHAVRRVTRGVRYAYLPFVYDEAGRAIRDAERAKVGG